MATIKTKFGEGGANMAPAGTGEPTLAGALRDVADDLANLRSHFVELLQKLDANHAAATDHEATLTPAALTTIKG